mgnify:CR=1 FL=1
MTQSIVLLVLLIATRAATAGGAFGQSPEKTIQRGYDQLRMQSAVFARIESS